MRFIVRDIQPSYGDGDHREFDDFREGLVDDLLGDDFDGFWNKVAPPPTPPADPAVAAIEPPRSSWVEVLSLICVT